MATGNTIEARLRIVADLAAAIAQLKGFRKEVQDTVRGVEGAATSGTSAVGGAEAAARKQATAEVTKAEREAAAVRSAAQQAERDARRKAAQEQAEEARRQRREEAAARKAEEEARRKEREREREAKRKAEAEERAAAKALRAERAKAAQLAPQITDIVSGLATGQSPFTIAIQQGGQLRDIYGGFANAGRALLAVLTPLRVGLTLAGAAFAYVAYSAAKGAFDTDKLTKSIAITGNVAATSVGQVDQVARRISSTQNAAIGDVRETLQAVVSSGQFVGSTLDSAGRAVTTLRKVTGGTAEEVLKDFDSMAEGVAAWAEKANKSYNFLSAAQFRHIANLAAEGRQQEAMRFTLDQLSSTLEARLAPNIGIIERLWNGAGRAVAFFADQLKSIGRDDTAEQQLERLKTKLQELIALRDQQAAGGLRGGKRTSTLNAEIAQQEAEVAFAERAAALARRRQNEAAEQAALNREEIKQASLAYQNELSQLDLAGARKRQQQQLNALDAQQAVAEAARAKGLASERAFNAEMARIEQERIRAQIALLQRQRELTAQRLGVVRTPEEKRAVQTELLGVEQQVLAAQSQLRVKTAQARSQQDAADLASARELAQAWAQVWQRAADQVRSLAQQNALAEGQLNADPVARARAEAEARVAELSRSLKEQRRELQLQIDITTDPGQRAALVAQLEALGREGKTAIERGLREGSFASVQAQLTELLEAVRLKEQEIDLQVEQGKLTTVEAERAKFAARAESIDQLNLLLAMLEAAAKSPAEQQAVQAVRIQLAGLKNTATEVERTLKQSIGSGFAQMFTDIATGSEKASDAVRKFLAGVARSMLDLIARRLGEQLLKSLLGNGSGAAGGSGGNSGWVAAAAQWIAGLFHTGGVIGQRSMGVARAVSPLVFAGAQVLHAGGMVGVPQLRSNERAVIAEVGEEMLTTDDPRHRNNLRTAPVIGSMHISVHTEGTGTEAGDADVARRLERTIKVKVQEGIAEEMRPGGALAGVGRGAR